MADFAILIMAIWEVSANIAYILEMMHAKIPDLLRKRERTNVKLDAKVSFNIAYKYANASKG